LRTGEGGGLAISTDQFLFFRSDESKIKETQNFSFSVRMSRDLDYSEPSSIGTDTNGLGLSDLIATGLSVGREKRNRKEKYGRITTREGRHASLITVHIVVL
jgi:hypothetical protein